MKNSASHENVHQSSAIELVRVEHVCSKKKMQINSCFKATCRNFESKAYVICVNKTLTQNGNEDVLMKVVCLFLNVSLSSVMVCGRASAKARPLVKLFTRMMSM